MIQVLKWKKKTTMVQDTLDNISSYSLVVILLNVKIIFTIPTLKASYHARKQRLTLFNHISKTDKLKYYILLGYSR